MSVVDWDLADWSVRMKRVLEDITGQDLLESKDEVVEMPDGKVDHCRYLWPLGGVTMAGF